MLTEVGTTRLRRATRALLLVTMAWSLSGCGAGYLLQAAKGQWQVLRARQPISRVIGAPGTAPQLRSRLEQVREARAFAVRELALPDNASYTTYAALGRPYVVWNVVAVPEFSLAPRRWCFPFTGCIAYRGYFREADARRYAGALAAQGNDTLVAGVAAYSTLGKFADPVLDTMMGYGDLDLVGTIFHELAHQLVYVKHDTEFNESFAMSVERAGVARWLAAQGRGGELAAWQQRQADQAAIVTRLADGRVQLARTYAVPMAVEERRAAKQEQMAAITRAVRDYESERGLRSGYDAWLEAGLNNAHLVAVATYFDCVPGFERLLAQHDGDLPGYYEAVRALARGPVAGRRALCAAPPLAQPPPGG
jgi:predicted aminopeptidase